MPPRNFRFRNAIADVPILNGAQFGQAALCAADDVLVHPTDTGCVGAESWRYAGGQSAGGRTQIFEDTRARPIKISAILEMRVFDRDLIRGEHYPADWLAPVPPRTISLRSAASTPSNGSYGLCDMALTPFSRFSPSSKIH
jgi:hypothetical protein